MAKKLFFTLFLLNFALAGAQTLASGNYTSSDGYYTVSVTQNGDEITLTEPNKVNVYKSNGNNMYYHTEPKYSNYYLRVTGDKEYYTGKTGAQEYLFNYSGAISTDALAEGLDECPLYNKYLEMMSTDGANAQAWAFCAAAAIAGCTYSEAGAAEYTKSVITTLKSIMDDPSTCPCTDVVPEAVWDSVN